MKYKLKDVMQRGRGEEKKKITSSDFKTYITTNMLMFQGAKGVTKHKSGHQMCSL